MEKHFVTYIKVPILEVIFTKTHSNKGLIDNKGEGGSEPLMFPFGETKPFGKSINYFGRHFSFWKKSEFVCSEKIILR